MYKSFRQFCEKWLRIPPEPDPPPGDESTARVFRAAPNYQKYLRVLWGIRTAMILAFMCVPLLVASVVLLVEGGGGLVAALAMVGSVVVITLFAAFSVASLALIQLNYERRWYLVTDRSLRIREGVLTVREITFTFANIQNLSVTQGPVQRLLGLADLKVETAGGGSGGGGHHQNHAGPNLHTAYFRGVDNAEEVKELVARRMRGIRDSGLGDHDDASAAAPDPWSGAAVIETLGAVLVEAKNLRRAAGSRGADGTAITFP